MTPVITYQSIENGQLTGYIFKTYRQERSINGVGIVDIIVKRLDKYDNRTCFLKQSGKVIDFNDKISLNLPWSNFKKMRK